ncbi:MAG: hypothetical protein H3C58_13820 [Fimbriimonadaceae bacterium]|nr:hypothetical protein [Fimbriimonadaceae bacterium]MBZ0212763.1 hypothetical protein [Fimbriimonadaceae bacterium]
MKSQLSPVVVWVIIGLVVVVAGFFVWRATDPPAQKVDLTKVTKEDLEDPDPPKRGQPGYRERITDPPQ